MSKRGDKNRRHRRNSRLHNNQCPQCGESRNIERGSYMWRRCGNCGNEWEAIFRLRTRTAWLGE